MSEQPRHHDMGGRRDGEIERAEHVYDPWEKRVDAMLRLLSSEDRRLIRVDELRRGIESLPADAYDAMTYYERWVSSIVYILTEKGVVTQEEMRDRIAELKANGVGLEQGK
ncbi:MAG: nitrile hydratase subunit beta [Alphaproteobacteria bacterium]